MLIIVRFGSRVIIIVVFQIVNDEAAVVPVLKLTGQRVLVLVMKCFGLY